MNIPFYEQLVLVDGNLFEGFLVLFFALLLARLAPLPREMQPLIWFGHLAKRLAAKVNKPERSPSQRITAGLLASLLLILPFWGIISFLLELAAFPWFFEFLVLYLCLNDASFSQVADDVAQALKRDDNAGAKRLLRLWVARDTQNLSPVGVSKATIEKLVSSPVYGTAATLFFFGLAGASAVLAVRMLKQLELAWPALDPRYRHFNRPVYLASTVLLLIPSWLWSFSLAIQGGPRALKALLSPPVSRFPLGNTLLSLHVSATILGLELGGPQKFNNIRIAVEPIGRGPLPNGAQIRPAVKLASRACALWFSSVVILPMLWAGLRWQQSL
ncbi:cobalamin biosynthesis protein [Shewanella sp. AS16]|uniref:cobalamin biosynthesis protein CobD/CbiB n=1 Tax=Shewanella sp. AS16 TaxID=2907625 RepID=UPI001F3DD662|nr:cobalamin biosynthesis protein [Shewanella sp. AS16]MCE9685347.1 cobalamin biosynthesis protein [Shewanella sp. AS16]